MKGKSTRMHSTAILALVSLACVACVGGMAAGPQEAASSMCPPTREDVEGPYYVRGAPERSKTGEGLVLAGTVRRVGDCVPIAGARIEWWSVNESGNYDPSHRATTTAARDGSYRYETDFPRRYWLRPRHVHVKVSAAGYGTLTTQVYPARGQREITFDFHLRSR